MKLDHTLTRTDRNAKCVYFGKPIRLDGRGRCECSTCRTVAASRGRNVCACVVPSNPQLPFFEDRGPTTTHRKGAADTDDFYCGCMGWD